MTDTKSPSPTTPTEAWREAFDRTAFAPADAYPFESGWNAATTEWTARDREASAGVVNINEMVEVVLNDLGVEIMRKQHDELYARLPDTASGREFVAPPTDKPTKFQLWALMQAFGEHISLGRRVPFDTEITLLKVRRQALQGAHE